MGDTTEVEDMGAEMEGDMDMDMMEGDMMEMEIDEEKMKAMRDANLAFLMMAGASTAWSVVDLFFWKWQIKYTGNTYNSGADSGDQEAYFFDEYRMIGNGDFETGWWRLGSLIGDWSMLAIMGTAFLTQLLSMFVMAMWLMAYRLAMSAWAADSDTNSGTTQQAAGTLAENMANAIEWDMLKMMAHDAAATLVAWENAEMWMHAQFMALSPEEQMAWKMEHGDDMKGEWSSDDEKMHDDMDKMSGEEETAAEESAASEEETADDSFDNLFGLYRKNVFGF